VIPEEVKSERLMILQRRQQEIQMADNQAWIGRELDVMVEDYNEKLGQWAARTTANRVVNFTALADSELNPGDYVPVRISRAGANSFVGAQMLPPVMRQRPIVTGPPKLVARPAVSSWSGVQLPVLN
jgi:tRNA-2-methylthio-N6-dimethylallyladenosine synthase